MWKILAIIAIITEIGLLSFWVYSGAEILTKTQVPETVTKKDELFGTEIQETVLKDKFILGLDYTGPAVLILGTIGVVSLFMHRKEQKKLQQN